MGLLQMVRGRNITADGGNYYYARLTDDQKKIYAIIHSGLSGCAKRIKLPMRPANELSQIYRAVLLDNPLFFYATGFKYQTDTYKQKNIILPSYEYKRAEINEYKNAISEHLHVYDVVKDKSDREKEQFVHDYCADNFAYGDVGNESHTILGLICKKTAVCDGIANYVKVALDYLGISSLVVSGKAQSPLYYDKMEAHAWNIAEIDGQNYHLDVTFDMTVRNKLIRHDYFNLCDDDIKKDHLILGNVPKCLTDGKDYYTFNDMAVKGKKGLVNYLTRKLKDGEKTIIVKLAGMTQTDDIYNKVLEVCGQAYMNVRNSGVSVEVSGNLSQLVFEIDFK
ncbi:MAG: hypothetical protein FWG91_08945 [Lachnospiraceae bacterium]|nr:hypothetical protein [Lachnospiraceae bacterium]